jgi:hypothetical protein
MGAEHLNSLVLSSYYDFSFRPIAHQLLAWGYEDSLPRIHCKLEEEEITGFIAEAIEERLDDSSTPKKFRRYDIHEEKPIAVEGRTGKKRRRLDLVIICSHRCPRPKYVFEAKLLRKNGFPISKYVGKGGLQCFTEGIYASQYPEAAMIGYDQNGDANYWESELKRRFDGDPKNDLRIIQLLQKVQVLSSMPDVWVSEHERITSSAIAVYHIFLNCSASSAPTII